MDAPPLPSSCGIEREAVTAVPEIRVWDEDASADGWVPPPCTGWEERGFRVLVELTGRIRGASAADLLARIGALSAMEGLRYWSVSEDRWEVLVTNAAALTAPDADAVRPDFRAEELVPGADLFFTQTDNRSSRPMVYRLRVLAAGPDRIVATVENTTPLSKLLIPIADPGSLQSLHVLERRADGAWDYRMLSRTGLGATSLMTGHTESLVNRAAALYRHIAGLPDDMEPPAAP